jgi:hypothetical protein
VLGNGPIGGEEALGVPGRLESLHAPFPLSHGLVSVFGAIVQVPVQPMRHTRQELPLGCTIAGQCVGNNHPRHVGEPLEQLAEEPLRGCFVASTLHQDIEHVAVLIDRPPHIMAFLVDREKHLAQMPLVAWSRTMAAQLIGIGLPNFPTPIPHRLVRQDDAALGHEPFDIPIAKAQTEVEPHTVADELGWEAMMLVGIGCR